MSLALFNFDGLLFVLRWLHFFFGIIWIGHLYYFNFVQGAFFAETDANTKSAAIQKLVPRALWWFRWGAMFTIITGVLILGLRGHQSGMEIFATSWGVAILTGALLGTAMWYNVWFIIWPAQKVVIQSAVQVAGGGAAIPEAAARGARAGVASRTNTLLSIPMLFFMGAASHLPINVSMESNLTTYYVVFFILLGLIELNAYKGKTGPMTTVKGVIHSGFALALALYFLMEVIL